MNIITDINKMTNRRIGKTYLAANFVKKINGILICMNRRHAEQVSREHKVKTLSINEVIRGKLLGNIRPTFYDQECLCELEYINRMKTKQLKEEIETLNKALKQIELFTHDNSKIAAIYSIKSIIQGLKVKKFYNE